MFTALQSSLWLNLPARRLARFTRRAESQCGALDLVLEEIWHGHAEFSTASQLHDSTGAANSTMCSTILDLALGAAVQSLLPGGAGYRVIGLNVSAVPGARNSGDVTRAIGDVVRAGGRVVTARGRLVDAGGALMVCASLVALADHDVALAAPA
jgi:acyl-coenzyme A thioesterase PaaI-like protein